MNKENGIDEKSLLIFLIGIFGLAIILLVISSSNASAEVNATVCCEQTTSGFYCQNVPSAECKPGAKQTPTACSQTSFCKIGTCYESSEGTCTDNVPQIVCNNVQNGSWSLGKPAQCDLGCCILGDQAAFVSLVRCKRLSAVSGLITNYNKNIKNEVACVLSVKNQDKGACVFESEFERTCKFTTKAGCNGLNGTGSGEFFKGKLCSAPELGTICGKTKETICVPGKDEVYFRDTCGNPANIYDTGKIDDVDYWSNLYDKTESCNPNNANANSRSCGNCNYLLGSFCRDSKSAGASASYGNNICADLNCKKTENGQSYKHGESWCVYNDKGTTGKGDTAVGARFYKHICINGQETLEQCADFKQEECIEDKIKTPLGDFSQAACRVNRWQDTLSICAQASATCVVTFEKGLFSGEECKKNCECLTDAWTKQRNQICSALGDCGPKINWVGDKGYKSGYNVTIKKK